MSDFGAAQTIIDLEEGWNEIKVLDNPLLV